MVLYLSFMQMASRCCVATPARDDHPLNCNKKYQEPTGDPDADETQALCDIRVRGPKPGRASIEPKMFGQPSKSKPVAFWQRYWLPLLRRFSIWMEGG